MPKRLTHAAFLARARTVHGNRYSYPEPYTSSRARITIACGDHTFRQWPWHHLYGHGCPSCAGAHRTVLKRAAKGAHFVLQARQRHGDLYCYAQMGYIGQPDPITVTCRVHGSFLVAPKQHLKGEGCGACRAEQASQTQCKLHATFLMQARSAHGDRYDYPDLYARANTRMCIVCREHGSFLQSPAAHISGHGCPECARIAYSPTHPRLASVRRFETEGCKVHDCFYSYCGDYVDKTTRVRIVCPSHGPFSQQPKLHLKGHGCPACAGRFSKSATAWLDSLRVPDREINLHIPGRRGNVDGYDPATRTVFQFHGDYFHGNPAVFPPGDVNAKLSLTFGELHQHTLRKDQAIRDAGYDLVIMWEHDWRQRCRQLAA